MNLYSKGKYKIMCSRLKITVCVRQFTTPVNCRYSSSSKRFTLPAVFSLEACICCLWSFLTNKANSPIVQTGVTIFMSMAYPIFASLTKVKNKPDSNPNKPNLKRKANLTLSGYTAVSHWLITPGLPLYKPSNEQYYRRSNCRCSSMVEHSSRKAEVEGSTPSIGCSCYMRVHILRESPYGNSN